MSDSSKWLNSCYDQRDPRAPRRAFILGAGIMSLVAVVCSVATDPFDFRLLGALLIGAILFGGGCSVMFASPPSLFRCQCLLSLELVSLLPLKFLIGVGWVSFVLLVFALFVGIMAVLSVFQVLFQVLLPSPVTTDGSDDDEQKGNNPEVTAR